MHAAVTDEVSAFLRRPRQMLVDGAWVEAASSARTTTFDPATGDPLTTVPEGSAEDVDRAVRAARRAFSTGAWPRLSPAERGRLLWRLGDLVEKHGAALAMLESRDNGKPMAVAQAADVPLVADMFRYMAGFCTKLEGSTLALSVPFAPRAQYHAYTRREPLGVVGQIIAWNFPLLLAAWKLGPALAAGNTVVLKPAEQTPLSALRLGELIMEAGFPPGVVNIVCGLGPSAGAALAAHPDVDKIAFTGSTEVGRHIARAATGNLKKVTLELGGKSPNVILADADVEAAIAGAAHAIFFNHGQCCVAGSRLFVADRLFEQVVEGVAAVGRGMRLGPGLDPASQMGPLVSQAQQDRVCGYLRAGQDAGARAVCGGQKAARPGYFVEPTVLVDTRPDMSVVREEIFGPVVTAMPFADLDTLVAAANDTPFGLGAGIWTRDVGRAHRLAAAMRAGTVWVNCYNVFDAGMPFGGYKQSGWGREMGREGLEQYTETKSVCIHLG